MLTPLRRRCIQLCSALALIAALAVAPSLVLARAPSVRADQPPVDNLWVSPDPEIQALVPLDPATLAERADAPAIDLAIDGRNARWLTAFSGDGTTLVAVSAGRNPATVSVRDGRTGAERRRVETPVRTAEIAAVSRDGARLVLFDWDTGWHLVDTTAGRRLGMVRRDPQIHPVAVDAEAGRVYRLVAGGDVAASQAALADVPPELVAFDLTTGAEAGRVALPGIVAGYWSAADAPDEPCCELWPALALSPDGRRLAVVHADRDALTLVDAAALRVTSTVALSRPTTLADRLRDLNPLAVKRASAKEIEGVSRFALFSLDGGTLYVSGQSSRVEQTEGGFAQKGYGLGLRVIDVASGEIVADGQDGAFFHQVVAAPDGRSLYAMGPADDVFVMAWDWEPAGGWPRTVLVRRIDPVSLATLAERSFDGYPWLLVRAAAAAPA